MERLKYFLLALCGSLLPTVASADPVTIAVVAGGAAAAGSVVAGAAFIAGSVAITAAVIGVGAAALSYYSAKQAYDIGDLGNTQSFAGEAANRTQMVKQAITTRRVIYGTTKVSGPILFMHTTNSDDILHLIIAIAGHEIESYEAFYLQDELVTLDGDPTTGLRNVNSTKFSGDVKIQAYLGTSTQTANANLISEASDKWTSNHTLSGIAYIYARMDYNVDDYPQGIPQVRCIVKGKKVYDPRTGSTGWTDNSALILRDYLVDTTYGLSATSDEIDTTSFNAAANLADEIVTITSKSATATAVSTSDNTITVSASDMVFRNGDRVQVSGSDIPAGLSTSTYYYAIAHGTSSLKFATSLANARAGTAVNLTDAGSGTITVTRDGEPRFAINGTIDTAKQPKAVIGSMMICQGATISYAGGKFQIIPASYSTPTLTFDEDDLTGGLSVNPKTSRRDRFNSVKGVIVDPSNDWQSTDFPVVASTAFATQDGQVIQNDLALEYIISPSMAQRVAKIFLLDGRQEMIVNASFKLSALQAQVGDIIYLKNKRFGFTETTETISSVNASTDLITLSADTSFKTGDKVTIDSDADDVPAGLAESTDYRVIKVSNTTIRLATTFQNAIDGTYINITDAGSGTLTLTRPTKAFRVIDFSLSPNKAGDAVYLGVDMALKEVDDSVYDYLTSEEVVVDPSPNTTLPNPFNSNQPPSNLVLNSGSVALGVAGDGTVVSRIKATWSPPPNSFTLFYELGFKRSSDANYTTVVVSPAVEEYFVGPVEDGVDFDVRVRAINTMGLRSAYATVTNHTVVGKTAPPPDVENFSVARLPDGTRRFTFSTDNFPADVKAGGGVLIRFSTNLSASWESMTNLRDIFRASPYETNSLAAGTYLFAIKMIDSSGNESPNAHTITATLGNPRIRDAIDYRIEQDEGWNGTLGTYTWLTNENTLSSTASETWADMPSTWDALPNTWASIVSSNSPLVYETPVINLNSEFDFTPLMTAFGQGTPTFSMKTGTASDAGVTGSYTSLAFVTGVQYIQLKVSMADTDPFITGLTTILDGEFVTEDYNDVNIQTYSNANFTRIAAGHFKIAITTGAASISQAYITAIQGSGSTALFSNLVSKSETVNSNPAAEFKIFDSSGTLTDATVDIFLKGPKATS